MYTLPSPAPHCEFLLRRKIRKGTEFWKEMVRLWNSKSDAVSSVPGHDLHPQVLPYSLLGMKYNLCNFP